MATEKVTKMILKVDLQCPCCYKKVKKTLCKFPQIRDQIYDEKVNQVAITVVCCSPEKIRDKLCCKGGKAIKSITIIDEKLKEPEKPKSDKPKGDGGAPPPTAAKPKGDGGPPPPAAAKPKGDGGPPPSKPKGDGGPPPPSKPKGDGGATPPAAAKPKGDGGAQPPSKPKGDDGGAPPPAKPKGDGGPPPVKILEPVAMPPAAMQMMGPGPALVQGVPSVFPYIGPSQDAYSAGPYYHGYGFPPPPPSYEGYYGNVQQEYGYGYGGVGHGHVNRSDYFSDENPQTCAIM